MTLSFDWIFSFVPLANTEYVFIEFLRNWKKSALIYCLGKLSQLFFLKVRGIQFIFKVFCAHWVVKTGCWKLECTVEIISDFSPWSIFSPWLAWSCFSLQYPNKYYVTSRNLYWYWRKCAAQNFKCCIWLASKNLVYLTGVCLLHLFEQVESWNI